MNTFSTSSIRFKEKLAHLHFSFPTVTCTPSGNEYISYPASFFSLPKVWGYLPFSLFNLVEISKSLRRVDFSRMCAKHLHKLVGDIRTPYLLDYNAFFLFTTVNNRDHLRKICSTSTATLVSWFVAYDDKTSCLATNMKRNINLSNISWIIWVVWYGSLLAASVIIKSYYDGSISSTLVKVCSHIYSIAWRFIRPRLMDLTMSKISLYNCVELQHLQNN